MILESMDRMGKKKARKEQTTMRQCANIKSRKHPDIQCPLAASDGEFCARHTKNPTRFAKKTVPHDNPYSSQYAAERLQRWWRIRCPLLRFRRQGPAINFPAIAANQTDIYTLDPVDQIPVLYRWSYADDKKHIWLFDVRSLSMAHTQNSTATSITNPYTRETLPTAIQDHFRNWCEWLRGRKYCIIHSSTLELTEEQIWHQKVLDTTLKYDRMGYHMCLSWFETLSIRQLAMLYIQLWELWSFRLQLDPQIKAQVVPGWNHTDTLLFKYTLTELYQRTERQWWLRTVLEVLDRLVSSAQTNEHKVLGALYGMTAFAQISQTVRQYYPWLVGAE
jgi:hypothetical protein